MSKEYTINEILIRGFGGVIKAIEELHGEMKLIREEESAIHGELKLLNDGQTAIRQHTMMIDSIISENNDTFKKMSFNVFTLYRNFLEFFQMMRERNGKQE